MTFFEWVEQFVKEIENPEKPHLPTDNYYLRGYSDGSFSTQVRIAEKLRYAIDAEKKRLAELSEAWHERL